MNKIKEFLKRVYIGDAIKTYKQMLSTWCFFCIIYLLCLIWYYTIKQIPILESLNNAYFLFGFILNTLIKLIVTTIIAVVIFLIPSVSFYHLMITLPKKRKEKKQKEFERIVGEGWLGFEKGFGKKKFGKKEETIRHANGQIDRINN